MDAIGKIYQEGIQKTESTFIRNVFLSFMLTGENAILGNTVNATLLF